MLSEIIKQVIGKEKIEHCYRIVKFYLKYNPFVQIQGMREGRKRNIVNDRGGLRLFLVGTPTHGNLGDQAIAYAQTKFLNCHFSNAELYEFDEEDLLKYLSYLKKVVRKDDILLLHGGGNMGNLYFYQEKLRQVVINKFPHNKIVIFPQTMDYGNTDRDQKALKKSQRIYNKHHRLLIAAREKKSYNMMKESYPFAKVILVPDIVLSLQKKNEMERNESALLCMRKDIEKAVSSQTVNSIKDNLSENNIKYIETDTVLEHDVSPKDRINELKDIWEKFSGSRFVITDRLHGMIFSVITGTPCIAFNNSNGKVGLCYEWIRDVEGVYFVQSVSEFEKALHELLAEKREVAYCRNQDAYKELIDWIKE